MIKHHPTFELLNLYVQGQLPASLSAGINIHLEHCEECGSVVQQLTEQMAEKSFEESELDSVASVNMTASMESKMINDIFDSLGDVHHEEIEEPVIAPASTFSFKNKQYELPRVLSNMDITGATNIGKLSRARVNLDEGEIHTSLLHIEPGGAVPQHTHKGYELTVLIDGSFSDETGTYHAGDFIMLDSNHTHQPVTENGCLCYTVSNDALHFTQGINKLLNPIGAFIY